MQALQATTREPAAYLGALDSPGTIRPGRLADLVLLDADPLADIRNTRRDRQRPGGGPRRPGPPRGGVRAAVTHRQPGADSSGSGTPEGRAVPEPFSTGK
jgi:N-acyl-D-aspartate/D-glutamate deacylase